MSRKKVSGAVALGMLAVYSTANADVIDVNLGDASGFTVFAMNTTTSVEKIRITSTTN